MIKKINKRKILKEMLMCLFIVFISIGLSGINVFCNHFVFIVPFVIFCFMSNKWYGYISFIVSFFVVGNYNKWFYVSYLLVILGIFLLNFFVRKDVGKFKKVICFYVFFLVLIEGVISIVLYDFNDYLSAFLLGVVSFWVMSFLYDLYINIHVQEHKVFTPFLSVFVLALIGVSLLGVYKQTSFYDAILTMIILIMFIASKHSLETGVLYSFIMIIMFDVLNISVNGLLFLSTSLVVFLLRKTNKLTLLFTYSLFVFVYLYYSKISYLMGLNYWIGAIFFALIPNVVFEHFATMCFGSEEYIEKIKRDNRRFNLEISNKILKMEEVFTLVSSKLSVKSRLKKYEKELLIEEINIFDSLLKSFACEIRGNLSFNYYDKIEKELYRYGYDLIYLETREDIFNNLVINANIRCDKKDIYKVIVPLICRIIKKNISVCNIKQNSMFNYYEVIFKEIKDVTFSYGIKQRAKDKEVCGDSYLVYENDNKLIYVLSDGMGIGKEAKKRSKLALDLFKKFMDIGFEEEKAINSINCILKSEYNKDSYATLDLFIYDKYSKEFSFCKNGACDSYIVRNKQIISVEGDKLPVGILDKIVVSKKVVKINKGDYIIMVSDGVSENKINKVKNMYMGDPIKISNEILKECSETNDDESVIVIKIK